MPTDSQTPSGSIEGWPCGTDCRYAQALPGSYGDWIWCNRPQAGGRLMREGLECAYFRAPETLLPTPVDEKRSAAKEFRHR